jgi:hypothetical protein
MEAFSVTIGDKRRVDVSINGITISGNGGYSAGYADGKADAESADAIEDAALLKEINDAIIAAALNPNYCAETLNDVPESVGRLYEHGYDTGKHAAFAAADTERKEVNEVLTGYGQPGADTLGDISAAVSNGIAAVNSQARDEGYNSGWTQEREFFWRGLQKPGEGANYYYAFSYNKYDDSIFNPQYDMVCMDNATSGLGMFYSNTLITDTKKPIHFTRSAQAAFYNMTSLNTIPKIVVNSATTFQNTFLFCTQLVNITVEGVIGQDISFSDSKKLSRASIYSIIRALSDTASGKSVTLAQAAVVSAFGSTDSGLWLTLCDEKRNWTISLV